MNLLCKSQILQAEHQVVDHHQIVDNHHKFVDPFPYEPKTDQKSPKDLANEPASESIPESISLMLSSIVFLRSWSSSD